MVKFYIDHWVEVCQWVIFEKRATSNWQLARNDSLNPTPIEAQSLKSTPIWDGLG